MTRIAPTCTTLARHCFAATLAVLLLAGAAPSPKYAEGQVWEYDARPQDPDSLLRIQRIENLGSQKVYHLSVIRVHLRALGIAGTLAHIPVSAETLDASVTRLSSAQSAFEGVSADEGIAQWRQAKGGVFTIGVSQIVNFIDEMTARSRQSRSAPDSRL